MKRLLWLIFAASILSISLGIVFTQDDAGISLDVIGIDSTDLSSIAIHASILDASGQLISGLGVGNFAVGGELTGLANVTRVENVSDDDLAFASVLVIDTSSSMADRPLTQVKHAARQYISALGPNDPVAIVTFNSQVSLVVDYTTDHDLLLGAIDRLAYGGLTALYDATHLSIEIASNASLPRRAVVILSDGGEYGDVSEHSRDESVRAATVNGIPVYTVGLGWSIDKRFLELISAETNADFYNSPAPEQLITIYDNLAYLFRTQYIVTVDADVPADGKRYDFTLEVTTDDGRSSAGTATLRAPIPIPLLFLPDDLFAEALTEDTTIKVEIRADQDIESIEYAVDGEVVATGESYTIEPGEREPGDYTLNITVSDVEGDIGRLSTEFEIAALPPTLSDDFVAAPQADVARAEVISVDAGGQTEITRVEFFVDGKVVKIDNEAPFDYGLDPFELSPEQHTLSIRATNAGGQSTTVEKPFDVGRLPPRLQIEGISEDTVVIDTIVGSVSVEGQSPIATLTTEPDIGAVVEGNRLNFTLNAVDFPPGRNTIAVRAVDTRGAEIVETIEFEVAALPPTVGLSGVVIDAILRGDQDVEVQAGGQTEITQIEVAFDGGPSQRVQADSFTIPAQTLGDGEHKAEVTVRNAGGESTTVTLPFTVSLPPTPTFTPTSTDTALPTDTPTSTPTQTDTPPPTDTNVPTATDLPTAIPTNVPTETNTAIPTVTDTAVFTNTAVPTITNTAVPTETAVPTITNTAVPTETPLPTETNTPVPTETSLPTETNTPVPTETPLPTKTNTPVPTETNLPTETNTPVPTETPLPTETDTPVPTETPLPTETDTPVPTETQLPTETDTPVPTDTDTPVPTDTNTPEPTDTDTPVPTDTDTPEPTDTDTPVPTDTDTPVPTDTDTPVPTDTETPVPTDTDTPVPTDTDTPVPTDTDTPIPTDTDTPIPTDTDTPVPTDTDTPVPTDTNTPVPTDTDTPVPIDTDTPIPTDTDTPVPTDTDTPIPTDTDTPIPTDTDTPIPTDTDTPVPTDTDTPIPTDTDTPVPTDTDTPVPTDTDTPVPTDTDTPVPTDTDTPVPTDTDTPVPTDTATPIPTDTDTPVPTDTDTPVPTDTDTPVPTDTDTPVPTDTDTPVPTDTDTPVPTDTDTPVPTDTDTPVPTDTDTPAPTDTDTPVPTDTDTPVPTDTDTPVPTDTDTPVPTDTDTPVPTATDTPTPTATATSTVDVTETAAAAASLTAVVQETLDSQATAEAAEQQATIEATETVGPTEQPAVIQSQATDAPTDVVVDEPTAQPTLTPVTIIEIEAPAADEPETSDSLVAIVAVAAGMLLLLILFLLSRRNRG